MKKSEQRNKIWNTIMEVRGVTNEEKKYGDESKADIESRWNFKSPVKMNSIKRGDIIGIEDSADTIVVKFEGFSDDSEKYGEGGWKFKTLSDAMKHFNVKNASALENAFKDMQYGYGCYAIFSYVDGYDFGEEFTAYLFKGRWSLGSGASSFKMYRAEKK